MTKEEFLKSLRSRLSQLPGEEMEKSVSYYGEIIDDLMEDGLNEYEAVEKLGSVSDIADQILRETPLSTLVRTKIRPKNGWNGLTIFLAVIGSPIWLPIAAALICVVIALYAVICAVIISVFAAVLALILSGIALIIGSFLMAAATPAGIILVIAAGFISIGIGLLTFFAAKAITKGLIILTKSIYRYIKSLFIRKEELQ